MNEQKAISSVIRIVSLSLPFSLKMLKTAESNFVDHCKQRAGRLYDNLKTLSGRSVVQIGNVKKTYDTDSFA